MNDPQCLIIRVKVLLPLVALTVGVASYRSHLTSEALILLDALAVGVANHCSHLTPDVLLPLFALTVDVAIFSLSLLTAKILSTLGTVGGACATYSAVRELTSTRFTVPYYVQPFLSNNETSSEHTNLNCCGFGQNITRFDSIGHCSLPTDFYNQNL
ncbi:unnamed protein product [Anisakis simplex]|uniref:Secreted protein n=1 Tax=Anisakis simplex TaxID=6269 RepID=A0A0M3IYQ1_ANISI|nr:unnamed protein product [Anisakis simplex]